MAKLPEVRFNNNIRYGVPYEYMDDDNDCWEAALLMLYGFIESALPVEEFSSELRGSGIEPHELPGFLSKFLEPHETVPPDGLAYYHFLDKHGPALVVLNELKDILHAQVLTGVYNAPLKTTVFVNNPDQNFVRADLSASGPFLQIERSIIERYQGISFEVWESTWPQPAEEESATPALFAVAPSNQSSRQSPLASPQLSPVVPRQRSNSNSNSPPPVRAATHLPGPVQPSVDWVAFKMQLERSIPSSASANKRRRYLMDMEEQYLFREHRPLELSMFQARLMREKGVPPLWTLRAW